MKHTRKHRNKKNKSQRHKRRRLRQSGGQATGGPSPAPAPARTIANLDYQSVVSSLNTFGNTVWLLKDATQTGLAAAEERKIAAQADRDAVAALNVAAQSLKDAYFGTRTSSGAVNTSGLYKVILPAETYIPPPPAPAPAPR